MTNVMWWNMDL